MTSTENPPNAPSSGNPPEPWTYPTRTCRICLEEVAATVTLYPPGLPPAFQRPIVEYKNDDEYGRLIKPCHCRGGMRYIHEHCLRQSRTQGVRPGSLWKCHECGYQFNFNRLTLQRYLGSKISSGVLTVFFMLFAMFMLGFVADPILNFYTDPYDTIVGREDVWQQVNVNESKDSLSGWAEHFLKGLVSMGVLSFLRTMILNPFQWWNFRNSGFVSWRTAGRSTSGRDRAVNISWLVVAMGMLSAAYFFYQWVQAIIGRFLQNIGNNIVDTQLPGDDDDLKPPSGWKFEESYPDIATQQTESPKPGHADGEAQPPIAPDAQSEASQPSPSGTFNAEKMDRRRPGDPRATESVATGMSSESQVREFDMPGTWDYTGYSSALDDAQSQEWSFRRL